ncbi:restriction endonuclease subunit S [Paenibacillus sp. UNC217MF]|uniref:restriction endonuclease subunit S n=1 Tax=Paenibacillus sp. UNC217MF TaxID=1449062 RepID=UPI00055ED117|nr:restriction endonuclease subunit S [Paenibacillus sp. UNC217MF]
MSKWEKVKLGDICEIERGGSPRPIDNYITENENGVNWIKIGDTTEDSMFITETKQKILPEGMKKSRYVQPGDFLLTNSMSFGRPYILKIDGCIHDGWLVLRDKNNYFHKEYLYYALSSKSTYNRFKLLAVGGVVNNLNSKIVKEVEVSLPPLGVQKQIAQNLDTVSELLDLRKKELEELDRLIKSVFYDMFGDPVTNDKGWEVKKLQDITSLITKGSSPNWQGIEYVDDPTQVLFVTSENVRETYLDLSKPKFLEDRFNDIQSRSILEKGDILLNIVGASIGRATIFDLDVRANINQAVALVRCLESECLTYICYYLNSPKAKVMYSNMQVDVARANLSLRNVNELQILYPPLALQNQFASIVTKIEEQKSLVKQSIQETQQLFDSLMSQYFD